MMRRVCDDTKPVGAAPSDVAESGAWLAEVVDDLPEALVVADADGAVRLVNQRAEQLLQCGREQLLGRPVADVLQLFDDDGGSWWNVVLPWSGRRAQTNHQDQPLTLAGRGPVLVSMRYIRSAPHAPVVRVAITLRKAQGLLPAETASADLIAVAAHELRAPLSSVRGFSATLLRQWDRFTDEQRRAMVATVETDAQRLGRLVHELLDVSRLGTPHLSLNVTELDLRALIEGQLQRLIGTGIEPDRFEWAESAEGDPRLVRADPDRVVQILSNLIENALIHGEGRVALATDVDEPGMVGLSVSDEGPGIDPEHYDDVFTKFWHGPRPSSTGLGLYLVKGLVAAHGGTVSIAHAHSGGTRFRVTFPGPISV